MTRKEAKDYLPIIKAYSEGKVVQAKLITSGEWVDIDNEEELTLSCPPSDYRIKPEPKYRPFKNQKECWLEMHKHPDFGWVKSIQYGDFLCINDFNHQGDIFRINISNVSIVMEYVFSNYTFTDGTPFGIKEE